MPAWPQHPPEGTGRDSGVTHLLIYWAFLLRPWAAKLIAPLFLAMKIQPHSSIGNVTSLLQERLPPPRGVVGKKLCRNFPVGSKSVNQQLRPTQSRQEHHPRGWGVSQAI